MNKLYVWVSTGLIQRIIVPIVKEFTCLLKDRDVYLKILLKFQNNYVKRKKEQAIDLTLNYILLNVGLIKINKSNL